MCLSCKIYEGPEYNFFETFLAVPDDAVQWTVEVKGEDATQSSGFGQSAIIFFDLSSDIVDLVDGTMSNSVMKNVTERGQD